jgi:hypothetical protein
VILLAVSPLLRMFYSALVAGVASSVVFSVALFGAVRASDMRRSGRGTAATAYGVLAAAGLVISAAIVIYGLILVAHKS